jgi:hypothetical protein
MERVGCSGLRIWAKKAGWLDQKNNRYSWRLDSEFKPDLKKTGLTQHDFALRQNELNALVFQQNGLANRLGLK